VVPELAAVVVRAPRSRAYPVDSARKSARGQGLAEGPVLERAMKVAARTHPGSSKTISDFSVLHKVSDEHLLAVAAESSIVFPSAAGLAVEIMSALRTKLLAQAKLALARAKIKEDLARDKERIAKVKEDRSTEAREAEATVVLEAPEGSGVKRASSKTQTKHKRGAKH
jgi:hypothetical protein